MKYCFETFKINIIFLKNMVVNRRFNKKSLVLLKMDEHDPKKFNKIAVFALFPYAK